MAPPFRSLLVLLALGLVGCAGSREASRLDSASPSTTNPCGVIVPRETTPDVVRDSVDVPPELVGGLEGLMGRIRYPEEARRAGIEGGVCVQFVVNEDGAVGDVEVVRSAHPLLDEEAVRAVRASAFRPGYQNGEPVRVLFSLPVTCTACPPPA